MKSYNYDAVTYDGECYCIECLPANLHVNSPGVNPIFASDEWEFYPNCIECGKLHEYMEKL